MAARRPMAQPAVPAIRTPRPSCLRSPSLTGALLTAVLLSVAPPPLAAQPKRVLLPTIDGQEPNASYSVGAMSADGRFLLVSSEASNLVPGDTVRCGSRGCMDVFVLDRDADGDGVCDEAGATTIELVSRRTDGAHADSDSYQPSISDDGRLVEFTRHAVNLLPPGTPPSMQVYVHDRQTHQTDIVSVSSLGEPASGGTDLHGNVISGNGRVVAFRPVFENAWVRVLDVRFHAGVESLYHRHALHNVAVRITGGTIRADPVGGQGVARYSPTGSVVFHSASPPYVHRVVNVGTAPVHIVDVELPGARPASDSRAADDLARHLVEIDNEHVRVSRVRLRPGESLPAHSHPRGWPHLVVGGPKPGAFAWHEAGHQPSLAAAAAAIEVVEIAPK